MCKYYGYIRVSTETQAEKGYGLEVQQKAIKQYAADNGIKLERIFEDAGISGTKVSRPGLDELLLETIKDGDIIIVHSTSRLWRNIYAQATIMQAVKDAKANIRSIDEPSFDVYEYEKDPENFMIVSMMQMLDTWERMTIVRKLARGRATKAKQGDKPAGLCPYGYEYSSDKKSVIVNADEAAVVKMMFTEGQKGRSLGQIADTLNGKGLQTRKGNAWSKGSIRAILKNEFYTGMLHHAGQPIKGNHEAIISKIQFGKVQAQLERRHK